MTVIQLFGHDTSTVSEANFELVFGGLHEGVFAEVDSECEVNPTAPATAQIRVEIGTFVTGGVFARVSAAELLTIPANVSGQDRIDRIICKRDNAANLVTVEVLQGTPAAVPVPPALTRVGDDWEISLAQVYVANGFVTITQDDIWDERNSSFVCGKIDPRGHPSVETALIKLMRVQKGGWVGGTSAVNPDFWGILADGTNVETTPTVALGDDGAIFSQATAAAAGSQAYVNSQPTFRRTTDPVIIIKLNLVTDTDVRFFAGLHSGASATMLAADSPALSYVGLQYANGPGTRGDSNWMFVSAAAGVQTLVDSRIAVSSDPRYVRITSDGAVPSILVELLDESYAILSARKFTAADNLPPAGTSLRALSGIEARAAAIKTIWQFYCTAMSRI